MKLFRQSRRRFLRNLTAVPVGVAVVPALIATQTSSRAKVVVAKRASAADEKGKLNEPEVTRMLDDAVVAAIGKSDARAAWRSVFGPQDVVGIKVNCLAGRGLSSHPELVRAIVRRLASAGVPAESIIVWDRTKRELAAAGFELTNMNGAKVLATDSRGVGYERSIEFSGEVGSCFSRILTRFCTTIINVPVMKDHDLSGVSLGMKNFYGAIHNPNKYHDNNCNPYIADLCAHPLITRKLRLVICDGLKGQYHGGPACREQWSWPAGTLLVGTDPVAVDRIGLEIIERKREEMDMGSLKDAGRSPGYIRAASRRGLGVGELSKISKVEIS